MAPPRANDSQCIESVTIYRYFVVVHTTGTGTNGVSWRALLTSGSLLAVCYLGNVAAVH
jgi:hypothetical protein